MCAFEIIVSVKYVNKYQHLHRFCTITEDIAAITGSYVIFRATCHRITGEQKIS